MKVLFLVGLQGSGKTTWAKDFCSHNKDWVRVCRDDLRHMRGTYWLPKQEKLITEWENNCILSALKSGLNVIVDSTNLNKELRAEKVFWLKMSFNNELDFDTKYFDVPVEECIKRDLIRANSVGSEVIYKFYNKYIKQPIEEYKPDPNIPDCIICDLDGTLAILGNRNPYDRDFENDRFNDKLYHLIEPFLVTAELFIVSGRSDKYKSVTIEWLKKNGVSFTDIYMRPEGDSRKDAIIKKEIFDKYIRNEYNPIYVFDDRNQIVELWRSMGLTCYQIADGNF